MAHPGLQSPDADWHLVMWRDLETVMVPESLSREQEYKLLRAAYDSGPSPTKISVLNRIMA